MKTSIYSLPFLFILVFFCGDVTAEEIPASVGFNITMDARVLCADVIVTGVLKMDPTDKRANLINNKFLRTGKIKVNKIIKGSKDLKELKFKFLWTDQIGVKITPKFKEDDSGLWLLVYDKTERSYSLLISENYIPSSSELYKEKEQEILNVIDGFDSPKTKLNSENPRVRAAAVYKIASRFDYEFSRKALLNASNNVFSEKEIAKIQKTLKNQSEVTKQLLSDKMNDPDSLVSLYTSIIMVQNYYDYKAVKKLIDHLQDESLNIRLLSATALHQYTGRTFIKEEAHLGDLWNKDPEKWKATVELWNEWWAQNKNKHFIQWLIESGTESKEPLTERGIPFAQLRSITGLKYLYNPYAKTVAERREQIGQWRFWWWLHGADYIKKHYPEWMEMKRAQRAKEAGKNKSKTKADDDSDNLDDF